MHEKITNPLRHMSNKKFFNLTRPINHKENDDLTDEELEEIDAHIDEFNEKYNLEDQGEEVKELTQEELLELVRVVNDRVEQIPEMLINVFTNNDQIYQIIDEFRMEKYSKLKKNEKKDLISKLVNFTSSVLPEGVVNNSIRYVDDTLDGEYISVNANETLINKDLLKYKSNGIRVVETYVNKVAIILYATAIGVVDAYDLDPNLLSDKAYYLYLNFLSSALHDEWDNLLEASDDKYLYQPLVAEANILTKSIEIAHIRYFLKKYGYLDAELSIMAQFYSGFINNIDEYKRKVKDYKKTCVENKNKINKEIRILKKFNKKIFSNLSKLSDNEFYELFNDAYVDVLDDFTNPDLQYPLTNLFNEFFIRAFAGKDLTNIEFPKYTFSFNEAKNSLEMYRDYPGQAPLVYILPNFYTLIDQLIKDIKTFATEYDLFEFKDENEYADFLIMKEWIKLKDEKSYSQEDNDILSDELNPIAIKQNQLYRSIIAKIQNAIDNSDKVGKGKPCLPDISFDGEIDFHEYKNGKSKEEITTLISIYIKNSFIKLCDDKIREYQSMKELALKGLPQDEKKRGK